MHVRKDRVANRRSPRSRVLEPWTRERESCELGRESNSQQFDPTKYGVHAIHRTVPSLSMSTWTFGPMRLPASWNVQVVKLTVRVLTSAQRQGPYFLGLGPPPDPPPRGIRATPRVPRSHALNPTVVSISTSTLTANPRTPCQPPLPPDLQRTGRLTRRCQWGMLALLRHGLQKSIEPQHAENSRQGVGPAPQKTQLQRLGCIRPIHHPIPPLPVTSPHPSSHSPFSRSAPFSTSSRHPHNTKCLRQ